MKNVRLLRGAEEDLREAAAFLERRRSGLGSRFISAFERSVERLAKNPNVGPVVHPDYRKLRVRRFPYNLIYRLEAEEVLVTAVAHHRRRPGYWIRRR